MNRIIFLLDIAELFISFQALITRAALELLIIIHCDSLTGRNPALAANRQAVFDKNPRTPAKSSGRMLPIVEFGPYKPHLIVKFSLFPLFSLLR